MFPFSGPLRFASLQRLLAFMLLSPPLSYPLPLPLSLLLPFSLFPLLCCLPFPPHLMSYARQTESPEHGPDLLHVVVWEQPLQIFDWTFFHVQFVQEMLQRTWGAGCCEALSKGTLHSSRRSMAQGLAHIIAADSKFCRQAQNPEP